MTTTALRDGARRSGLLFLNLFLILLAYYQVKPASRSLFLESLDAEHLPWTWTASGLLLLALMPLYQRALARFERVRIVQATTLLVVALLLLFRLLLAQAGPLTAAAFYVFADIFSVVLVEQFWSLTNASHEQRAGRRWYGLIAAGGLIGGLAGGVLANRIVALPGVRSEDLLVAGAALMLLVVLLTAWLDARGAYRNPAAEPAPDAAAAWRAVRGSAFVALLALLQLLAQVCEPIVEYQFMHVVEDAYPEREARTAFLAGFLALLSGAGLFVNLLVTPLVLRHAGIVAGLLVQPLLLASSAVAFGLRPDLRGAGTMKVTDRALSYSINRAARELLYVGAEAGAIFRLKAWIDMVGYRVFKIVGNVAILAVTQVLPWAESRPVLVGAVVALCAVWAAGALALGRTLGPARPGLRPATPAPG